MSKNEKQYPNKSLVVASFNFDGENALNIQGTIATNKDGKPIVSEKDGQTSHKMYGRISVGNHFQNVDIWVNETTGVIKATATAKNEETGNVEPLSNKAMAYINVRGVNKNDQPYTTVSIVPYNPQTGFDLAGDVKPITFTGTDSRQIQSQCRIIGRAEDVESTMNGVIGRMVEAVKADPNVYNKDKSNKAAPAAPAEPATPATTAEADKLNDLTI